MAGNANILALIALLGCAPLISVLFVLLPARRALVIGSITAWLLLPPVGLDIPGFPDYDKATAAVAGILAGTLIFELKRLLAFRPRWFDLPMLLWSLCPYFSAISNEMGAYDGLSAALKQSTAWLLPYLLGRLYLTDAEGLREFAIGLIVGGVCLIPFTLFEIRMSPRLLPMIYGFGKWEGTRYGGFRPRVFFATGIEFGLWMNCVTLLAWWHWRTGQLKRLLGLPGGVIFTALLVTAIGCRATSAMVLNMSGVSALLICRRTRTKWMIWGLLLIGPIYYAVRLTDSWSGSIIVELSRALLNEERAQSIQYRLDNENLFVAKVWQRPILGWGGWGRRDVYEGDKKITVVDGRWIVAVGDYGLVGLAVMTTALLMPAALYFGRFSVRQWDHPSFVSATGLALVLNIFVLDGLINGMPNILYVIAAGGLVNIVAARATPSVKMAALSPDAEARMAAQYRDAGRALKDQGRFAEAKTAWFHALDCLTKRLAAQPSLPGLDQLWCDCANDLAWLLLTTPDPAVRDPILALALASKTTEAHAKCGTYCNTLGAAQYRVGEFNAAISTLGQAIALQEGGTAFDHFFLAMAHAQLSNQEQAQHWFNEAKHWMEHHAPDHTGLIRLCEEARSMLAPVP